MTLGSMWLHSSGLTITGEAHITVRPQTRAFRPRHVLIPDETARGIMLRGIVVLIDLDFYHSFDYSDDHSDDKDT